MRGPAAEEASLNSHMPTIDRYREMLGRWKELPELYDMDRAPIIKVLGSADITGDISDSGEHPKRFKAASYLHHSDT